MARGPRTVLTWRWLLLHLLTVALCVAMVLLGRWQLGVSEGKGFSAQNFFYALQWWVFTGFTLFFWGRVVRDALRPPPPPESTGGEIVVADRTAPTPTGPALLTSTGSADTPPAVYRGYVMPQSGTDRDRSGNDVVRDAYNDHLWQLALADAAAGDAPRPTTPRGVVDLDALERSTTTAPAVGHTRSALPGPDDDPRPTP